MPVSLGTVWGRWWAAPNTGLRQIWRRAAEARHAGCRWRRDPLSHPALQAMSQRELGDLPFDPRAISDE